MTTLTHVTASPAPKRVAAGLLDPRMLLTSLPDALRKLDPRVMMRNPVMFVVEVGAVLSTVFAVTDSERLRLGGRGLALADRGVRQPRRGGGRGPRQGAGRHAAAGQDRDDRTPDRRNGGPGDAAEGRRPGRGRGRRGHPRRRRRRRGRGQRRRVGDHRRVGPGHPGVRRRPELGHRRHQGALRPDRRRDHRQAGRELHRPDDRPRRGRQPAEDAQRDRAQHPAREPDHRLPGGHRDPAAVRGLLRRRAVRSSSSSRCWSA